MKAIVLWIEDAMSYYGRRPRQVFPRNSDVEMKIDILWARRRKEAERRLSEAKENGSWKAIVAVVADERLDKGDAPPENGVEVYGNLLAQKLLPPSIPCLMFTGSPRRQLVELGTHQPKQWFQKGDRDVRYRLLDAILDLAESR